MFDDESNYNFLAEVAKTGRATCKHCKTNCDKNQVRLAKLLPNAFGSGKMKQWYHVDCLFEAFTKQRATTKKIESASDIQGWDELEEAVQDRLLLKIKQIGGSGAKPAPRSDDAAKSPERDDSLMEFRRICYKIGHAGGYSDKTRVLQNFLKSGTSGSGFKGDLYLWIKYLMPMTEKRVYNLKNKQLVKLFSRIFNHDHQEMLIDLELGDVAETIEKFFKLPTSRVTPATESVLYLQDVEDFLKKLSFVSKEDEQMDLFEALIPHCTEEDLKLIIRFIKYDLRINTGPKHILEAVHKDAYTMYQNSRNLQEVIEKFSPSASKTADASKEKAGPAPKKGDLDLKLMTPIMPMLAAPCKDLDKAISRCPTGMYSEIKYDGERVQLHKQGKDFSFYSRSLKPVMEHKIKSIKKYVPTAFPNVKDLILDAEVIMVDADTGDMLPFGTLGIHKRETYEGEAQVCLFIFDCLYLDGDNLTKKPLEERRKILKRVLNPIKNRIQLSESKLLKTKEELLKMVSYVLKQGLEGLVLKKADGIYEPNKRHWWKIKKDYLCDGSLADSADLVVLGAWFGTGKKGGLLSIFLMGCFDEDLNVWKTVTKAHSGLDDDTIHELQRLKDEMVRPDPKMLPHWLCCNKPLCPDMIAKDPMNMPVFEIVGAEFSKGDGAHTADGISIRFPRVKKIREDKEAKDATTLQELQYLYKVYKENQDVDLTKLVASEGMAPLSPMSPSTSSSTITTTTAVAGNSLLTKYFTPMNRSEESSKRKAASPSPSPSKDFKNKKPKLESFFKEVVLYIPKEVKEELPDSLIDEFLDLGGVELPVSSECSHVLHLKGAIEADLNDLRKIYRRDASHVRYTWLVDCIKERRLLSVLKYPVCLRSR